MAEHFAVQGVRASVGVPTLSLLLFRIPFPCTLESIEASIGASVPAGSSVIFDVRAGATLSTLASIYASPADRLTVPAAATGAEQTALAHALVKGWLAVDLLSYPAGGLVAPAFVAIMLDDGVAAGGSLEVAEADASPDITTVTKLVVGNGDLTDTGGGVARLKTAADALSALLVGGKLDPALLPALAITDKFVAASQSAMLALSAQQGDVAFRTDVSEVYLLAGTDPTNLSDWVQWLHPAAGGSTLAGDVTGTLLASVVAALRGIAVKDFSTSLFLADNFDDGAFDSTVWARDDPTQVTESGGVMNLTAVHNLNWAIPRQLTNRYISAKLVPTDTLFFRIVLDTGVDYIECRLSPGGGYTRLGRHSPGAGDEWTVNIPSYDATNDKWLKVAHQSSDNTWHFLTSPDGATWTDRGNCAPPSGATATAAVFYLYCIAGALTMDDFDSSIPATGLGLADGDTLVYRASANRFENVPAAGVIAGGSAPSGPPSNALPGTAPMRYDKVNHRLYVWNENTSQWDWRAINNS